jgi:GNAT superfamily N-acetyltransferase
MTIRKAFHADLPAVVKMLANDPLGATRERLDHFEKYKQAFEIILNDRHQELMVIEDHDKEIIGTFQLTFIQYLAHQGRYVAQIESVRVREDQRGKGVGEKMFHWAFQYVKEKGAQLVQLTSDKRRPDAKRFYERLGFVASHEGFKRIL